VEFIAGLNLQRRRIAATPLLILMLIAGQHARAAETTGIITLSCEGTVRSGHGPGDVERVSERGIVVNLAEHTVTGFVTITGSALIANIVHVDDIRFEFTGGSALSSVFGTIDRVTGATTVHTTTWVTDKILGSKIIRGLSYYLVTAFHLVPLFYLEDAAARLPRRRHLSGAGDFRAPPPPLRGQHRLQGSLGAARDALLRHVARRAAAGDHRVRRPSLVHRGAVPPRAQIAAVRAASAVLLLHRGGGGAEPARVTSDIATLRLAVLLVLGRQQNAGTPGKSSQGLTGTTELTRCVCLLCNSRGKCLRFGLSAHTNH